MELNVNLKEMTPEQIAAFMNQFNQLQKQIKEAKKEGLIPKAEKAPKPDAEKDPEVALFVEQLKGVLEANVTLIEKLYTKTVTDKDPIGQIGINFNKVFGKYGIQLLNDENRVAKTKANKEAKKAEKPAEEPKAE